MASRKAVGIVTAVMVLGFISVLIVLSVSGGVDVYSPMTDDPAIIFQQACARCHGENGVGGDEGGPRLVGLREPPDEVKKNLREGKGKMPRFPNIQGRPLDRLAVFVSGL